MLDEEALNDVGSEREADPAVALAPARLARLGVRPEEVAQYTRVRDVGRTEDAADLIHALEVGREAAVHCDAGKRGKWGTREAGGGVELTAEDVVVDEGSDR